MTLELALRLEQLQQNGYLTSDVSVKVFKIYNSKLNTYSRRKNTKQHPETIASKAVLKYLEDIE